MTGGRRITSKSSAAERAENLDDRPVALASKKPRTPVKRCLSDVTNVASNNNQAWGEGAPCGKPAPSLLHAAAGAKQLGQVRARGGRSSSALDLAVPTSVGGDKNDDPFALKGVRMGK